MIRDPNGKMRRLKMGDVLRQGDQILTTQDGIVQLTPFERPNTVATAEPIPSDMDFDKLDAPGAGLTGGDAGSLSEGFRVGRIAESLTPASLVLPAEGGGVIFDRPVAGPGVVDNTGTGTPPAGAPLPANSPPSAVPGNVSGLEDSTLPVPLLGQDPDGQVVGVTVTVLPSNGTLLLADGVTTVVAGVPLSPADAAGLVFRPDANFNGATQIEFTVTDDGGVSSTPAFINIRLLPVNDLPTALNDVASTDEDTPLTLSTGALLTNDSDSDGGTLSLVSVQNPVNGTVSLVGGNVVFTPNANYNGPASFTYTVSDGQGGTATATVDVLVRPLGDAPVARDDSNGLSEDGAFTTLVVGSADGVIQSAGTAAGRDTDADGDTLSVVAVRTGAEAGVGTPGTVGSALQGTYGTLSMNGDGSYTYLLANASPQVQNLSAGEVVADVFTYTVSDGQGGTDNATLSINVTGAQDLTAGPPGLTPIVVSGLSGSYYGYNDTATTDPALRTHADDGLATFGTHGATGNLNSVEDVELIVNGRNALVGGPDNILGTSATGQTGAADVVFTARNLDYGFNPTVDAALGSNAALGAGAALPPSDGDPNSLARGLSNFLGADALTTTTQVGGGSTNGNAGLGTTTDVAMRLSGQIYVQPGSYDFRVTGDDGFRLRVAGETLLEYDGNQWPTARVFTNVPLGDLGGGLQSFELLYWEQGGNARLRIEYKPSGAPVSDYQVMSDTNTALFTNEAAPVLADPRIQDIIFDSATGGWQVRTGSMLDGDAGNNTLIGGISRDLLRGGAGNDVLDGGGGADQLEGGVGDDTLNGGLGNDLLMGGAGVNTLVGGNGDDTYRLSDGTDTLLENAGEGTDTVQLDSAYVARNVGGTYTLGEHFENLFAKGAEAINLNGNAANNRLGGTGGDNALNGGDGNDFLVGGAGNDLMTGGVGADVFAWRFAEGGAVGSPTVDTITDFDYGGGNSSIELDGNGQPLGGGDVLDLRDLLQGEHTSVGGLGLPANEVQLANLTNYIDVEVSGGNTVLHISSNGGFTGGAYDPLAEDERIVLQNTDLYAATGITSGDENGLLQTLIKNGTMIVD